ncbi:MAG: winged helix-turn-helix transcriptional regulator [Acidimicrobiales bacterium]
MIAVPSEEYAAARQPSVPPSAPPAEAATRPSSALEEALARVGDRWTLLVVSALLERPLRFGDLLGAIPGLAPNILSARLKHLGREGLVISAPYCRRPVRLVYSLSSPGAELAGALRLLSQWGAGGSPDAEVVRDPACGTPMEARWYCPTCARLASPAGTGAPDEVYLL